MTKIVRLFIILGLIGIVSACSSSFKSDVSRFHQLPQPTGEKVTIVPANPDKVGSLEFASYANLVGSYLSQQGYVPAKDGEADLIVELDYSVDDGKVMVRSYPSHSFAFGYHPFYHHGFYSPFWRHRHIYDRDIQSYVKFTRKMTMSIRPNQSNAQNIFEGTVESRGRSNKLPQLMPLMVQALFTNFPGVSGSTEKIVIDLDPKS